MAKEEKKEYTTGTIPTQTRPVIIDPDGKPIEFEDAIALILNQLDELKVGLIGK